LRQKLFRATIFLAGVNGINGLLGFASVALIAYRFGGGILADAFFLAQMIPRTFAFWAGKAINVATIPVFTEFLIKGGEGRLWKAISRFGLQAISLSIMITALYFLICPFLMQILAPGFGQESLDILISLSQLLSLIIVFTIFYALAESVLNTYKSFIAPAVRGLLVNLCFIIGIVLLSDRLGIYAPAWGLLVGSLLSVVFVSFFLKKYMKKPMASMDWREVGEKKITKQMLPVMGILLGNQLYFAINGALATILGEGRVSALNYAHLVVNMIPHVLIISAGTTLLPAVSEKVSRGEIESLKSIIREYLKIAFFIFLPVSLGIMIMREPIIRLLFERGNFTSVSTELTSIVVLFSAPCILAFSLTVIFRQILFALQKPQLLLRVTFISLAVNVLSAITFMRFFDVGGLGLAETLSTFSQTILSAYFLRKEIGPLGIREVLHPFLKTAVAALIMGASLCYLMMVFDRIFNYDQLSSILVQLGSIPIIGFVIYLTAALMLKVEDPRKLLDLTASVFTKKGVHSTAR
jgi:putative peptidoglycan lipid II flippase